MWYVFALVLIAFIGIMYAAFFGKYDCEDAQSMMNDYEKAVETTKTTVDNKNESV